MKKRFIRPIEEFQTHLKALQDRGKDFKVSRIGSRSTIFYENKKWVFGTKITEENKEIVYCCRRVKADAQNAIINGLVQERDVPETFPTLIKNHSFFSKHDYWFRFDIESCYWNIAYYNLPIISMKTYFDFYNKKDARNIALGALGKNEIEEVYERGQRVARMLKHSALNNIYRQVRYKAYEFYLRINDICNGDVGLYHTDEYIIPDKYVDKVLRYLKGENAHPKSSGFTYYHVRDIKPNKVLLANSIFPDEERYLI